MRGNLKDAIRDMLYKLGMEDSAYGKMEYKHNEFIKEFIDVLMNED